MSDVLMLRQPSQGCTIVFGCSIRCYPCFDTGLKAPKHRLTVISSTAKVCRNGKGPCCSTYDLQVRICRSSSAGKCYLVEVAPALSVLIFASSKWVLLSTWARTMELTPSHRSQRDLGLRLSDASFGVRVLLPLSKRRGMYLPASHNLWHCSRMIHSYVRLDRQAKKGCR